jgi:hypothetical protein
MWKYRLPLLLLLLSGCASGKPRLVILQHPETMEFQNCEADKMGLNSSFASNEECVQKYQKMGYVIWGER